MLRTTLLLGILFGLLSSAASAQTVYDFESLTGSDMPPYTPLDGQDGWSEETFNASNSMGVTATLSHDGTKSLRFQESGPGFGTDASRINDAAWSYPGFSGAEEGAYFQVDMHVGFWGGSFGVAHDTNGNGQIRASEMGERGVLFTIGTQSNVQFRLHDANGTPTLAQLAGTGIGGGHWIRVRVVMNLGAASGAGLGSVEYMNLSTGPMVFAPMPGLQAVPLFLTPGAMDASNPALWDAMWMHFEGATYGLDNVEFGVLDPGTNFCAANTNSTGVAASMRATGSPFVTANAFTLVADDLPQNSFAFFLTSQTQGFVMNPGGSAGNLCLGGSIGRYVGPGQVQNAGTAGTVTLALDLTQTPTPTGLVPIAPGETWSFQCWHRDAVGGQATSNFTDGLEVPFL